MGEMLNQMFINSEQVGEIVTVPVPSHSKGEEFDELEEADIHYLEAGVGEPLLLIHSIGQSLYTWRGIFAELSDHYRVIAVDLPGHGYSSRPDTLTYSMDDMAEMLFRFLDIKGIRSAHMIGFSMGAMYMLRMLSLNPSRVANCIAIAPGGVTEYMPKLVHQMMKPLVNVFARNLFSEVEVRKMLLECVADGANIDEHVVEQYYGPVSDGLSREALMYALRNFDMDVVADGLIPIEHEVLVLWGKEDKWHPPAGSVYFQGVLQNGRYYLIRNAGHLLQEEAPQKLLEIIKSYIPPAVVSYDAYRRYPPAQEPADYYGQSPADEYPNEAPPAYANDAESYDTGDAAEQYARTDTPDYGPEPAQDDALTAWPEPDGDDPQVAEQEPTEGASSAAEPEPADADTPPEEGQA